MTDEWGKRETASKSKKSVLNGGTKSKVMENSQLLDCVDGEADVFNKLVSIHTTPIKVYLGT